MTRRVLVSGYLGFNNFGDEAIFLTLSNHLKKIGFDVSALCYNKDNFKKEYNVTSYNYKSLPEVIKAILNCNVLISGGGSLLQNKTSNSSLYYYLFIIILSKILQKKVIIFAQGIEPIKGLFNKIITKFILKTVDLITVRDEKSLELLKNNNINSYLVSDPVYSLLENFEPYKNKSGLIVQLRHFKGINDDFIRNLSKIIAQNYNGSIKIFSFQDSYDKESCLKLKDELQKLNRSAEFISHENIQSTINEINQAEFMISTRLHGTIVSQALKTHTFALVYDDKVKTLVEELNIQNINTNDTSNIEQKLKLFFSSQEESKTNRKFLWNTIDTELTKVKENNE